MRLGTRKGPWNLRPSLQVPLRRPKEEAKDIKEAMEAKRQKRPSQNRTTRLKI